MTSWFGELKGVRRLKVGDTCGFILSFIVPSRRAASAYFEELRTQISGGIWTALAWVTIPYLMLLSFEYFQLEFWVESPHQGIWHALYLYWTLPLLCYFSTVRYINVKYKDQSETDEDM